MAKSQDSGSALGLHQIRQIDYWGRKTMRQPISSAAITAIVDDTQAEFSKGGRTVEFGAA